MDHMIVGKRKNGEEHLSMVKKLDSIHLTDTIM